MRYRWPDGQQCAVALSFDFDKLKTEVDTRKRAALGPRKRSRRRER